MKSTLLHSHWNSFSNIMSLYGVRPEDFIQVTGNIFPVQTTGGEPSGVPDKTPQLCHHRPVPFPSTVIVAIHRDTLLIPSKLTLSSDTLWVRWHYFEGPCQQWVLLVVWRTEQSPSTSIWSSFNSTKRKMHLQTYPASKNSIVMSITVLTV